MIQQQIKRSEQEWMDIIQECRTSSFSDRAWCSEHGIPISSFYNGVSRLRKKACEIPAASQIAPSQQVVELPVAGELSTVLSCWNQLSGYGWFSGKTDVDNHA